MQRADVDGVPVFSVPGPERVTAGLVFGVGTRDETFATREVTHLVEHLAMGALPRSHLKCNGVTDVDTTTFYATGRPAAVRDFLEGVCRALSDLPLSRMPREVGVLQAENCAPGSSTAAALWASRYGLTGPGLAVSDGPGPDCLTEDAVRAHAARWFVRENAAVWWAGAVPADLRLPLPSGPRPVRTRPVPRPQTGPVWTTGDAPGVGLLLAGPHDPALRVGVDVLRDRLVDVARHGRGLSYSTELVGLDVAADLRELAVLVDARDGQEAAVAGIVWHQFATLCQDGPTAAELAHAVAGFEEEVDGEEEAVLCADVADAATSWVGGLPARTVAEALASWRAVTPAEVVRALRAAWSTAVVYAPGWARWTGPAGPVQHRPWCGVVPALPAGTVFTPPAVSRVLHKESRLRIVVSEGGLAHADADGDVHAIAWDAVEAVVPVDGGRGSIVVGRDLCSVVVHPELYGRRTAERVTEALRARLPADRWLTRRPAGEPLPAP